MAQWKPEKYKLRTEGQNSTTQTYIRYRNCLIKKAIEAIKLYFLIYV